MKSTYIFDLDETLCDTTERLKILDDRTNKNRWHDYYEACDNDHPYYSVLETMIKLSDSGADILIWTGRCESVRNKTICWLCSYTLWSYEKIDSMLKMRPVDNFNKDIQLKQEWYYDLTPEQRGLIVAVFEDRDRVVKMWRNLGVPCFQVREGDY